MSSSGESASMAPSHLGWKILLLCLRLKLNSSIASYLVSTANSRGWRRKWVARCELSVEDKKMELRFAKWREEDGDAILEDKGLRLWVKWTNLNQNETWFSTLRFLSYKFSFMKFLSHPWIMLWETDEMS